MDIRGTRVEIEVSAYSTEGFGDLFNGVKPWKLESATTSNCFPASPTSMRMVLLFD